MIEQQNWDAADAWNRQAYALREQVRNPDKGLYLKLNAAAIASGRGNSRAAEQLYRDLISESKDVPYVEWDAHVRLGYLLAGRQQFPEANAEYERGLAAIERVQSSLIQDDYQLSYQDFQMEFFKAYVDLLVTEGRNERALQVVEVIAARGFWPRNWASSLARLERSILRIFSAMPAGQAACLCPIGLRPSVPLYG